MMISNDSDICLRSVFEDYSSSKHMMTFGDMFIRLYNPLNDLIIPNYSKKDWHLIFSNINEDDLRDLNTCVNVVILLWCDMATGSPHGMAFLEENYDCPSEVSIHGGTWDHNPRYYRKIFRSLVRFLDFLLEYKTTIKTSCRKENCRADKFLNSLCFEDTRKDDSFNYKTLNKQMFKESLFINKLRTSIL